LLIFWLQNFDLGPSLVDEVLKAFGGAGKTERLEKLQTRNHSIEENSSVATTPCPSDERKTLLDSGVVDSSANTDDIACEETLNSTKLTDCDRLPDVQIPVTQSDEKNRRRDDAESRKSNQVRDVSSESLLETPAASADAKCNFSDVTVPDFTVSSPLMDSGREVTSFEIWQQRQVPPKKLEQLPASVHRKNSGNGGISVIGNCSLSPRPFYLRDSAVRGLSATKSSPSSSSSSSEERLPAGMSSRVAASLVAASSNSLPARSSLVQDSWAKTKIPSGDSSDSESGNLLQRLKGKASLSRLSGFRLSIDSRTAKSGLPTQNLNVNVHFFNRLREQELQNSDHSEDDDVKVAKPEEGGNQTLSSSSVGTSRHLPSLRLDATRSCPISESRISEHREVDSSGVESGSSGGTDGVSPIFSSHDEVARLSCRSTESHDSFSHDSEHSSTTTQPSDEGVYSDDSVAASADELRPKSEQRTPTSKSTTAANTADSLGIADKQDVFWTCPVNFRDFVNIEENRRGDDRSQVAERYNVQTDMCYEDRMECELNGYVDMYRYLVLIFGVFHFILFVCPMRAPGAVVFC